MSLYSTIEAEVGYEKTKFFKKILASVNAKHSAVTSRIYQR